MCHQTQSLVGIEESENCSCYGEWRTVYFTIITDLTYVFMTCYCPGRGYHGSCGSFGNLRNPCLQCFLN